MNEFQAESQQDRDAEERNIMEYEAAKEEANQDDYKRNAREV
jgi:hypothetical protein